MPNKALDEFFTMYHEFNGQFLKILKKGPAQLSFLTPLYPNFVFSWLQHKIMIIYMLFNSLGRYVITNTLKKWLKSSNEIKRY